MNFNKKQQLRHDINSDINAIISTIKIIRSNYFVSEEVKNVLDQIIDREARINENIAELLDLVKVDPS